MKIKNVINKVVVGLTIALALVMITSAWGGLVSPLHSRVIPLLTLAMPFIFILNIMALVVLLVFKNRNMCLVIFAALLISWPGLRTICPLNFSHDEAEAENTFRVMTFNVFNFGPYDPSNTSPSESMRYILDQDADFVLLQEGSQERDYLRLSNTKMMRDELERKYPYHSDGNRDLVILSKYPYDVTDEIGSDDRTHHYNIKAFDIKLPQGKQLRIINTHLHNTGISQDGREYYEGLTKNRINQDAKAELRTIKHSLLDKLDQSFKIRASEARELRQLIDNGPANVILCGDFNDTPSSYSYRTIKGDDMSDSYVDCGLGLTYTFHKYRMFFKIDHIMYRGNLKAVSWQRDKMGDSDHYPQLVTFEWK